MSDPGRNTVRIGAIYMMMPQAWYFAGPRSVQL